MAGRIKKLKMTEISGVDFPAHLDNGWAIRKSFGQEGTNMADEQIVEKSVTDATPEEIAEVAKGFTPEQRAAVADALGLVEKSAEPVIEPVEEDITKSLSPEQVALVKSLEGRVEALQKAAAEASRVAEVEKAARLDGEAIAKSKAEYANLTIEHEVVAPALRKMADTAARDAIEGVLKSLNTQAATLFVEKGTTGGEAPGALAELKTIAKSLVSEGKAKSEADGFVQALSERPELYSAYLKGE